MAHLGFTVVPQVRGRFSVHRVSADEAKFKLCRVKEVAKGVKGVPYMVTHDGRTIRYPDPQLGFMDTIKLDLETGKVTRCPRTAPDSLPAAPRGLCGLSTWLPLGPQSAVATIRVAISAQSRAQHSLHLPRSRVMPLALTPMPCLLQMIEFVKFETGNLAMINGGKNTGRIGVIVSRERHQGSFDIVHLKDSAGHVFATRLGNVFVIGQGNRPMVSLPKRKGIKMTILEERALRPPKN